MKCQNLFSGKNKEIAINLSSAELVLSMLSVNSYTYRGSFMSDYFI